MPSRRGSRGKDMEATASNSHSPKGFVSTLTMKRVGPLAVIFCGIGSCALAVFHLHSRAQLVVPHHPAWQQAHPGMEMAPRRRTAELSDSATHVGRPTGSLHHFAIRGKGGVTNVKPRPDTDEQSLVSSKVPMRDQALRAAARRAKRQHDIGKANELSEARDGRGPPPSKRSRFALIPRPAVLAPLREESASTISPLASLDVAEPVQLFFGCDPSFDDDDDNSERKDPAGEAASESPADALADEAAAAAKSAARQQARPARSGSDPVFPFAGMSLGEADDGADLEKLRRLEAAHVASGTHYSQSALDALRAAKSAFEEALHTEMLPMKLGEQFPPNSVAVAILPHLPAQAFAKVCCELVGCLPTHQAFELENNLLDPTTGLLSQPEWHLAVHTGGRLAVCSAHPVGAFRFASTLKQMLDEGLRENRTVSEARPQSLVSKAFGLLPSFVLQDWPSSSWRGLQLDCVRHFMPVEFLKNYLKTMSYYKASVFHWHLTDDVAWRLEIPSRPKLAGANPKSPEFYSEADVREVVTYAASLFIDVLPTIETPGHALAALSAYPELACSGSHFEIPDRITGLPIHVLCVSKKEVADFMSDVIAVVVKLFPFPYVHIGGDEVSTAQWDESPHIKAFAVQIGLHNTGPDVLETWFCHLSNELQAVNRSIIMWDDHFQNRAFSVSKRCPHAEKTWVVQAWKMLFPVSANEETILSGFPFRTLASPIRTVYLDYPVASTDFNRSLNWKITEPGSRTMGGSANMWTEDSKPEEVMAKVYPRYLAITDRLWGGPSYTRVASMVKWTTSNEELYRPRSLDEGSERAAHRHCSPAGPLPTQFGVTCGKFAFTEAPVSATWKGAEVLTNMVPYGERFRGDRALDEDEGSYFWAIAPPAGGVFTVSWADSPNKSMRVGKWFTELSARTGSVDRPADQLVNGRLSVAQWLPNPGSKEKYKLKWVVVGSFKNGRAHADSTLLDQGPVAAVQIESTQTQIQWMALVELTAKLGPGRSKPSFEDLPLQRARLVQVPMLM